MNKTYRTSPAFVGYGARIFIDTKVMRASVGAPESHDWWDPESFQAKEDFCGRLDSLSVWGGNSSSTPSEYYVWEFGHEGLVAALTFLASEGWELENNSKPVTDPNPCVDTSCLNR